jgi:hypothetical protein
MCLVGREEWKINMVGTCQTDRCGASPLGKVAYTGKDKEIAINRIPVMAPISAPTLG